MMDIREIQQRYGAEMALAVLIGRVHFGTADIAHLAGHINQHNIDWLLFEKIIKAHHIRPLAYKILAAQATGIEASFIDRLKRKCLTLTTASMQQMEELKNIERTFKVAGIRQIPYKGVVLSQILFGDTVSREAVDIDLLLMEPASFSAAREALLQMGYSSQYYNPAFEKQFLRTSHELQFSKDTPSGQLKVEVHWQITSSMMAVQQDKLHLFENLQRVNIAGYETDTFNPSYTLLALLIHHGVNDIWRSQKHIIDIAAFISGYRSDVDWQAFEKLIARSRIRYTAQVGFMLAHHVYGVEIPKQFHIIHKMRTMDIVDDLLRFPALTKGKLQRENLSRQLLLRDSFPDKIRLMASYLRTAVTPNVRDIEALPLPGGLYWLYYFIKPFRMLLRRKKVNAKK